MVLITAFFTDKGVPKTGLAPLPTIRIRNLATTLLVVTDAAMVEVGDGFYKYDYAAYDPTIDYAIRCDGGAALSLGERYTEGVNEVDDAINNKATQATADEILDLLENRCVVNQATSEMWLYDDTGMVVIKKWPLRDHLGGLIILGGTGPSDRLARTL